MSDQPLEIHFLNVGHGDCTVIDFPSGNLTMVDINTCTGMDEDTEKELFRGLMEEYWQMSSADRQRKVTEMYKVYEEKLVHPVIYLKKIFPNRKIFRFVATHPDMDHLSGLSDIAREDIQIINFWDTPHKKTFNESDFQDTHYSWEDWIKYQYYRNESIADPKTLHLIRGADSYHYGTEHDGIEIWSPTHNLVAQANEQENYNHLSYVLAIRYGQCFVVLGGDASQEAWSDIYNHFDGQLPKVNLLKASHHGRDSGFHLESVKAMQPDHVVVSVGKKPETDASDKYRAQANNGVYSTRFHGTITAQCYEDGTVLLWDRDEKLINKQKE